jgi:hypothetical protein
MLIDCCILLDFLCELYYDARIHEHEVTAACRTKLVVTEHIQTELKATWRWPFSSGYEIVLEEPGRML